MAKKIFIAAVCLLIFSTHSLYAETKKTESKQKPKVTATQADLSEHEKNILETGYISDKDYYLGGAIGTFIGFGIGHAIQGRYSNPGWIFTVGEVGSMIILSYSIANCVSFSSSCSVYGTLVTFATIYSAFHIWEIVDVWAGASSHNRSYRKIKEKLGEPVEETAIRYYLLPLAQNNAVMTPGISAGLQFQF